jgi:glycosyltransferase involved in cell wall biosynthesis
MFGGPLQSHLSQHGLETHVKLRGSVPHETLLGEMNPSDICVSSAHEACPIAMLEAICLGKPVVAFDLPFSREILGEYFGLLGLIALTSHENLPG